VALLYALKVAGIVINTALIAPLVAITAAIDGCRAYDLSRVWAMVNLAICGVQVDGTRRARLDPTEPYVFMSNHASHFDVIVERQIVAPDYVDVGLSELAESALLGSLPPPCLLDLVATKGELQLACVLQHVTSEGNRQIEVHAEARVGLPFLSLQSAQDVELLVIALTQQTVQRLDDAGFDAGVAVQLEDTSQRILHCEFSVALGRQELGESA